MTFKLSKKNFRVSKIDTKSLSNKQSNKINYHSGGLNKKLTNKWSTLRKTFIAMSILAVTVNIANNLNEFQKNKPSFKNKCQKYEKDTISKPLMNEMKKVSSLWLDVWRDATYLANNANRIWSFSAIGLTMRARKVLIAAASSFAPPGVGGEKYAPPLDDDWVDEVHMSRIPGPLATNAINRLRELIEYIDKQSKIMKTKEYINYIQKDWKNVKEFYSL